MSYKEILTICTQKQSKGNLSDGATVWGFLKNFVGCYAIFNRKTI